MKCLSDLSCRMIHAGFLVKDQAAEDPFYRAELHFKPYWYGAFTAGKVDWVSQQVPQGRDWLEYMLANDGSDTPANKVTRKELGGMDHISLGVGNMEAAVTMLLRTKRLTGDYNGPKMGLDGKWQTNLYDPDGTRIELMEYAPSMAPCCSPSTAAHPVNAMVSH
jgi:catechol 2,3-dioxygenase-like lactoylglutathione lyase family enzyme